MRKAAVRGLRVAACIAGVLLAAVSALVSVGSVLAADEEASSSSIEVAINGGLLGVDVRDAPLAEVLRTIGMKAGFEVVTVGDLDAVVTYSFADVPLEDAIWRLLYAVPVWTAVVMVHAPPGQGSPPPPLTELRVRGLGRPPPTPPPEAEEVEEALTDYQDRGTRLQAVRALLRRTDGAAASALGRYLTEDTDAVVRRLAAIGLGRAGSEEDVAALRAGVADRRAPVRLAAVKALENIGGAAAVSILSEVLSEGTGPKTRRQAARALGRMQEGEGWWALQEAANTDPDPRVRETAADALDRWASQ